MLFNSFDFLLFFPIVLIAYYIIPHKLRYIWLLVASYYFYMSWNATYVFLILFMTIVSYLGTRLIDSVRVRRKKTVLVMCLILNLGFLFFFKYANFFIQNYNGIMSRIGRSEVQRLDVVLPVGISFYTFQVIGSLIDVYRGEIKPEKNIGKYALFVSFFPLVLAGPIERSKNLLSQIDKMDTQIKLDYTRVKNGFITMLWGYFLKMVVADRAASLVDAVFSEYLKYGALEIIGATVIYAIQIYCDFLSYSTIAVGAAEVLGFSLVENFNTPYLALSIKDFWRRWHISLSSWLRDYLYIPLGGSRCSKLRKYFNILITFLVSGLWHGANWTFIVWGGLHGVYQIVGEILEPIREKISGLLSVDRTTEMHKLGKRIVTFVLVDFAWLFFRADTVTDACIMIRRVIENWNIRSFFSIMSSMGNDNSQYVILLLGVVTLLISDLLKYNRGESIVTYFRKQNVISEWIFVLYLTSMILVFGTYGLGYDAQTFIYFQF